MMLGKATSFTALVGVSIALFMGTMDPAGAVCSNGLQGIENESFDVCCVEACGLCGGVGCTPANTSTLTSADCCASEIVISGSFCSETNAAPCIMTATAASNDSVCENGMTGVQDPSTDVCCPLECGTECGGAGCGTIPGVDGSQCCSSTILASGAICSDTVDPPCAIVAVAVDNSTCSNDIAGIEDTTNLVCCDAACGQCGGPGCGDVPGLTSMDCCSEEISITGELCSVTNAAPCIVDPPAYAPSMCPNGLAGVQDDSVCCAEECNGICGGAGCGTVVGTNGSSDCCSTVILAAGVYCEVGVFAPCIMINGTYTNAPAVAPTFPPAPGTAAPAVAMFTQAPTILGDVNGDGVVDELDVVTPAPAKTVAPSVASRDIISTETPTLSPTLPLTPSPEDLNGDGVVDSQDEALAIGETPAPTSEADAADAQSGAMSFAKLPSGSVYAGVLGATVAFGGMLL